MKTKIRALALVFFLLLGVLWMPVKSAVVIQEINDTEYENYITNTTTVWSFGAISGFTSAITNEITVSANTTVSFSHLWSIPEQIGLSYDGSGNLNVRVGSDVANVQPLGAFNAILIRLRNLSLFDEVTELRAWDIENVSGPNLLASNSSFGVGFKQVLVTGISPNFTFDGSFYKGEFGVLDDSAIFVTGIQIPEPSTLSLLMSSFFFLIWRKR